MTDSSNYGEGVVTTAKDLIQLYSEKLKEDETDVDEEEEQEEQEDLIERKKELTKKDKSQHLHNPLPLKAFKGIELKLH